MIVDIVSGVLGFIATSWLTMSNVTYGSWILFAVIVAAIVGVIMLTLNLLVYRKEFAYLLNKVMKKV